MIPIENQDMYNTIFSIVVFAGGYATKHYADLIATGKKEIQKHKAIIHAFSTALHDLDQANMDDSVNTATFTQMIADYQTSLNGVPAKVVVAIPANQTVLK